MSTNNYLTTLLTDFPNCHDGIGVLQHCGLLGNDDFKTKIKFINYTVLPPETTIGEHTHENDEELYIIVSGSGTMIIDGEKTKASTGDIFVNKPYGSHGLINNSNEDLCILVIMVDV